VYVPFSHRTQFPPVPCLTVMGDVHLIQRRLIDEYLFTVVVDIVVDTVADIVVGIEAVEGNIAEVGMGTVDTVDN